MLLKRFVIIGGLIFKREYCANHIIVRCYSCEIYKSNKMCSDINTSITCDYINSICTAGYLNFHNLYYVAKC